MNSEVAMDLARGRRMGDLAVRAGSWTANERERNSECEPGNFTSDKPRLSC